MSTASAYFLSFSRVVQTSSPPSLTTSLVPGECLAQAFCTASGCESVVSYTFFPGNHRGPRLPRPILDDLAGSRFSSTLAPWFNGYEGKTWCKKKSTAVMNPGSFKKIDDRYVFVCVCVSLTSPTFIITHSSRGNTISLCHTKENLKYHWLLLFECFNLYIPHTGDSFSKLLKTVES